MKYFYSHLIDIESVIIELDSLDLTDKQKIHLAQLLDSTIHMTVLDIVLSELNEEDKRLFLRQLALANNDQIWELLNNRVDNIESKIKAAADDLKTTLHKDIKDSKEIEQ